MSLSELTPLLIHNPNCSKCRAAKAWMDERGEPYRERLYLEQPLSAEELRELGGLLGLSAKDWVRSGEAEYQEAELGVGSTDEELIQAMGEHPVLVQRPIVVHGGRAAIGRPLELVQELFI